MSWDVWELPGPSQIVEEVIGAFQGGSCVVAQFPTGAPVGMADELRRRVRDAGLLSWRGLDLAERHSCDPLSALGDEFGTPIATAEALADSMMMDSTVLWLDTVDATGWAVWGPFVERFARAARTHAAGHCGVIGIALDPSVPSSAVRTEAGVQVMRWRGRVTRLDVQLYLALHVHRGGRPSLDARLRTAIATELGGTDIPFGLELARRSLRELVDPVPLLRREATQRGWDGPPGPDPWIEGRVDELDGRKFEHSASLAARGEIDAIVQRLWRAELSVIFPELEERRVELVKQLRPFLRPMDTVFGPIERVEDLELAHVLYQVRHERITPQTRTTLYHLNELRKSLAHLEPVSPRDLVGARFVDAALLSPAS